MWRSEFTAVSGYNVIWRAPAHTSMGASWVAFWPDQHGKFVSIGFVGPFRVPYSELKRIVRKVVQATGLRRFGDRRSVARGDLCRAIAATLNAEMLFPALSGGAPS